MASATLHQTTVKPFSARLVLRVIIPTFLIAAALLIGLSTQHPYWQMHLDAPQYQYRDGLDILVYVDSMTGKDPKFDELRELNSLNHYIGMRALDDAAQFERSIAKPSVVIFILCLLTAALVYSWKGQWKFTWLLLLPPLTFPFVFAADLYYWLRDSGMNLDPHAPLSSTIKPFMPTMLGEGVVGQFSTDAYFGPGWYMITAAAICIVLALGCSFWLRLKAGR